MSLEWASVYGELGPCSCCGHVGIRFTDADLRCFGCLDNDDACCLRRESVGRVSDIEEIRRRIEEVLDK